MKTIQAVLFDLDGTLLDTANDLFLALNDLRQREGLQDLSFATVRPLVSLGVKAILQHAFDINEKDERYPLMRKQYLQLYEQYIAHTTKFFPNMDKVLTHLEESKVPWGIVTNKHTHLTHLLLKALALHHRPACIVCGDTLPTPKPDPAPILHACQLLKLTPAECLYVGDSRSDVLASKAAGSKTLVALYGYIDSKEDPCAWEADGYIQDPIEIIDWLK